MKKLRIFSIIFALCLLFAAAAPSAHALEGPAVAATSVIIADIDSGRTLYSVNMNAKAAPASLTKVMTVLIAVEAVEKGEVSLTDQITAQSDCRVGMDSDSSTADIYPGEVMSLEELLYCAMLQSANEACNIIATYLSGNIEAFVARMNERAAQLGCTGTHFANTNGLTDENHYSTAYDLSLITREAISHEYFMTLCNTITHTVPATNASGARVLNSTNALICSDSIYGDGYLFEGASGVKTGYTRAAGYCLISTATRNDISLICIVLGSTGQLNSDREDFGHFEDTINLYKWAFENFSYKTVLTQADGIKKVTVDLAEGDGTVILRPSQDVTLLLPDDFQSSDLTVSLPDIYEDMLVAPIEAGTVLGTADVSVNGEYCCTIELVNNIEIQVAKGEILRRQIHSVISSVWFRLGVVLLAVIIVGYIVLVARYRKMRRKQMREKKLQEIRYKKQAELYRQRNAGAHSSAPTRVIQNNEVKECRDIYNGSHSGGKH